MVNLDANSMTVLVAVVCGVGALLFGFIGFLLGFYARFVSKKDGSP